MSDKVRGKHEKQRWLLASVLLNAALSVSKLSWGWYAGSTIVLADGMHSVSDVFGAMLIFLALRFSAHRSQRFPIGMHKLEDLAATVGGLGIVYAGYTIIESVFFDGGIASPDNIWPTLIFMIVIIGIQMAFYFVELGAARRLNSPGVRADAINWLGDIGAGLVVVVALLAHRLAVPFAQEVAVVIIVAMILQGAYEVLRDGLFSLLDASVNPDLVEKARTIILSHPEVAGVSRLFLRRSGSLLMAGIVLQVDVVNMRHAHKLIDTIESELRAKIDGLDMMTIHYEPVHHPVHRVATLLAADKVTPSDIFGRTNWVRIEAFDDDGTLLETSEYQNPASGADSGRAIRLATFLLEQHVDTIVCRLGTLQEDIARLFDAMGVEVREPGEPEPG